MSLLCPYFQRELKNDLMKLYERFEKLDFKEKERTGGRRGEGDSFFKMRPIKNQGLRRRREEREEERKRREISLTCDSI